MHPIIPAAGAVAIWFLAVQLGLPWNSTISLVSFVILTGVAMVIIGQRFRSLLAYGVVTGAIVCFCLHLSESGGYFYLAAYIGLLIYTANFYHLTLASMKNYNLYHNKSRPPGSNEEAVFWSQRAARFPSNKIFLMPDYVSRAISNNSSRNVKSSYFTEDFDEWKSLMDEYPYPSPDEKTRTARKLYFWEKYTTHFSRIGSDGDSVLLPMDVITEYFEAREKWILREYYAACGEVRDPSIKRLSLLWEDFIRGQEQGGKLEGEVRAIDRFYTVDLPEILKQHCEWFFFHIDNTFRARAKPPSPTGIPIGGDSIPGTDYTPNI